LRQIPAKHGLVVSRAGSREGIESSTHRRCRASVGLRPPSVAPTAAHPHPDCRALIRPDSSRPEGSVLDAKGGRAWKRFDIQGGPDERATTEACGPEPQEWFLGSERTHVNNYCWTAGRDECCAPCLERRCPAPEVDEFLHQGALEIRRNRWH